MDNISHSVASLVAGELLHRSLPSEADPSKQELRRKLLLFTACAAGNFPDLDLFLYPLLKSPLGYLLHHRGHSHTFLYEIPQAILLSLIVWTCWPAARRRMKESRVATTSFVGAMAIGFFLHISMDYLNSYGVHPFYPFDSHWYFGDLVFIVEPIFWISFGVPLAMLTRRLWLRFTILLLMTGVPIFATFAGYLPWISLALLGPLAIVLARSQSRELESGRKTLAAAFLISLTFIFGQVFASRLARDHVRAGIEAADPKNEFLDAAMSASPANPFCWNYVSVEQNKPADAYRLRSGLVSIAPFLVATAKCPSLLSKSSGSQKVSEAVLERSVHSENLSKLKRLTDENCHVRAWLRFARMPIVTDDAAIDLRFAQIGRSNFTTLQLRDFESEPCSDHVPPWIPPRQNDLLKF